MSMSRKPSAVPMSLMHPLRRQEMLGLDIVIKTMISMTKEMIQ